MRLTTAEDVAASWPKPKSPRNLWILFACTAVPLAAFLFGWMSALAVMGGM